MEEALFETALYREFASLSSVERIPDRVSILRIRHLLEDTNLPRRYWPWSTPRLPTKA